MQEQLPAGPHAYAVYRALRAPRPGTQNAPLPIVVKVHAGHVDTALWKDRVAPVAAEDIRQSPLIAHVKGRGAHEGRNWVGYEVIDGPLLSELDDMGTADADRVLEQIIDAVALLHAHGAPHGQIHPNQFRMNGETPVLLDSFWLWNDEGTKPSAAADLTGLRSLAGFLPVSEAVRAAVQEPSRDITQIQERVTAARNRKRVTADDQDLDAFFAAPAAAQPVDTTPPAPRASVEAAPAPEVNTDPEPTTTPEPEPEPQAPAAAPEAPAIERETPEEPTPAPSLPQESQTTPEAVEKPTAAPAVAEEPAPDVEESTAEEPGYKGPLPDLGPTNPAPGPGDAGDERTTDVLAQEVAETEAVAAEERPLPSLSDELLEPAPDPAPTSPMATEEHEPDHVEPTPEPAVAPKPVTPAPPAAGPVVITVPEPETESETEPDAQPEPETEADVAPAETSAPTPDEPGTVDEAESSTEEETEQPGHELLTEVENQRKPQNRWLARLRHTRATPAPEDTDDEQDEPEEKNTGSTAVTTGDTEDEPRQPLATQVRDALGTTKGKAIAAAAAVLLVGGIGVAALTGGDDDAPTEADSSTGTAQLSATEDTETTIKGYSQRPAWNVTVPTGGNVFASNAGLAIVKDKTITLYNDEGKKTREEKLAGERGFMVETQIGSDTAIAWQDGNTVKAWTPSMGAKKKLITASVDPKATITDNGSNLLIKEGKTYSTLTSKGKTGIKDTNGLDPKGVDAEGVISGGFDVPVNITSLDGKKSRDVVLNAPEENLTMHSWIAAGHGYAAVVWAEDPYATDDSTPVTVALSSLKNGDVAGTYKTTLGDAKARKWKAGQGGQEASYGDILFSLSDGSLLGQTPEGVTLKKIRGPLAQAEQNGKTLIFRGAEPGYRFDGNVLAASPDQVVVLRGQTVTAYQSELV